MAHKEANGLVRELGLTEALAIGLGTMIGAGIFVLSSIAANRAGPGAAVSYIIAGLICLPISMTISELATGMPKAGGSYHLISRTLGPLAGTVVGIGNWLGLTFATGFYLIGFAQYIAYFFPIPLRAAALGAGLLFIFLNYRGSKLSGSVQNVIVVILILILALFVGRGLFDIDPALHKPFAPRGWGAVITNVGLIIVSFTGFEKISTIAEEIKQPGRNLPLAIIGSVLIATTIYAAVLYVATGILSYKIIADFQAPLVEAANHFMSTLGVAGMSLAALLATASSANAATMASSRINFAMGRDNILPAWFSKIHPKHLTPYRSIVVTGTLAILLALSGQATVLAEISSALFMVSYTLLSLGLIIMRRTKPSWYKPTYRVPLYPWLPILGGIAPLLVISTMDHLSQIAGVGLAILSLVWYAIWGRQRTPVEGELMPWLERERPLEVVLADVEQVLETQRNEILVPVSNPATAKSLVTLATDLAQGHPGTEVVAMEVVTVPFNLPLSVAQEYLEAERENHQEILEQAKKYGEAADVPVRTRLQAAYGVASGIVGAAKSRPSTRLILLGWHGPLTLSRIRTSIDKAVVEKAPCDVAVYLDKCQGTEQQDAQDMPVVQDTHVPRGQRILVPAGGGPHARLGLRMAHDLVNGDLTKSVVVLRIVQESENVDLEKEKAVAQKLIRDELGEANGQISAHVVQAPSVVEGILREAEQDYDMLVIGASEEWSLHNLLFGSIPDLVAERAICSVLLVRKHEITPVSWARRITRRVQS